MKASNLYLNTILTIVSICLTGILIQNQILIKELKREKAHTSIQAPSPISLQQVHNTISRYAVVPVNEDGSINVNITGSAETMDINIKQVNGYNISKGHLPVKPELTDVNIRQVGGNQVLGSDLPIKNEIRDINIKQVGGSSIGSYVPIRE
jgi:hypothetical protein